MASAPPFVMPTRPEMGLGDVVGIRHGPVGDEHEQVRSVGEHARLPQCEALARCPMALRWTGAAMLEAAKGFRRLKAHRQLPILKAALAAHGARHTIKPVLERQSAAA